MTVELPLYLDEETASEIRSDLEAGRKVTIQIKSDEAGDIAAQIEYQLETERTILGTTHEYREWRAERAEAEE